MANTTAGKGSNAATFEEFWPQYLAKHSQAGTRDLHILGTGIALAGLAAFAVTRRPKYLVGAIAGSYGAAWMSHAVIEGNKPATFDHPLWSLLADFKMFGLWANGGLTKELSRQKVQQLKQDATQRTKEKSAACTRGLGI